MDSKEELLRILACFPLLLRSFASSALLPESRLGESNVSAQVWLHMLEHLYLPDRARPDQWTDTFALVRGPALHCVIPRGPSQAMVWSYFDARLRMG